MDPRLEKLFKLPDKQKITLFVALLVIEAAALVWFLYLPKHQELGKLTGEHAALQKEIAEKTSIAGNLPKLQKEYDELNASLAQALTELPNSREIPSLLTGITDVGKGAGLDFLVFKPKAEVKKDFYAEVPVDVVVSGTYHSVASFFASVANLPRIVNITNVDFTEVRAAGSRMTTKVSCLATTFRFLGKEEIQNDKTKPKK
ncbi:type 4a pilus biogenesis protein PilO [Trichlorobacter ammonificans]|uniref:Type IV pilus biogenesis protein PilO n=1 Tax=Trichlorobacter ammonificans TaxID=2916410 RepID=A0ABN8HFR6_9BACT|nr:type 4a pilus biogenesis protein PilO [Trichlorobacter ammonificans]CAH2030788.1 Type IV pilus biogenesis protein PilO [Trichlorobacter ammonificans]